MVSDLLYGFFELIRLVINFGAPSKETRNVDDICRQLEVLQLDFSNAKLKCNACVYLVDPHKLLGHAKGANNNVSKRESNEVSEIPLHCFHYQKTNERDKISEQYEVDEMSISSDSDFEGTLQNHFQYTPTLKIGQNFTDDGSSTGLTSSVKERHVNGAASVSIAFPASFKPNTFSGERNFSPRNDFKNSGINNNKNSNVKGRKRRMTSNPFNESSPVERFCSKPFVASTPLSTIPQSEGLHQLTMADGNIRRKVHELKQRDHLNLSEDSNESMSTSINDETMRREQSAIAKHIARIRTSNSKLGLSKEALTPFNNSRYYSMNTSFGSNGNGSFS